MAGHFCTQRLNIMIEPTLEDMLEPKHIFTAMHKCGNGVRWKSSVQKYEIDKLRWAASICREVESGTYKSKGFRRFDIVERGKLRHIQSVHISERTVQKLLCDYALRPTVYPRLIYDNSASQEGKGTEFALKRLREHLRWHYTRYGKKGVVITMDYHDFFGSIPHAGSIEELTRNIHDERINHYIRQFVNAFDGEYGLGLGSETSQIGAIYYPNPVDRLVKEQYRIHCYYRYMDDSYIIHPDRDYACHCLEEIFALAKELGIEMNQRKTVIHNLQSDDFVFLKKRVRLTDSGKIVMRLTRENIREEEKRILFMITEYKAGRMPKESIKQSYRAWRGYAQKYNSYHVVGKMDKFFCNAMKEIL